MAARVPKGILRWEEPPPHANRTGQSKYQATADALRGKPGKWAVVAEDITVGSAGSLANQIRKGGGPWQPAGSFEARVVGPAGGRGTLYARYVGEDGAS